MGSSLRSSARWSKYASCWCTLPHRAVSFSYVAIRFRSKNSWWSRAERGIRAGRVREGTERGNGERERREDERAKERRARHSCVPKTARESRFDRPIGSLETKCS
eukprot:31283-Pelagococcus_subviridis.AAC.3